MFAWPTLQFVEMLTMSVIVRARYEFMFPFMPQFSRHLYMFRECQSSKNILLVQEWFYVLTRVVV